jgi:hypothetical protein
MVKLITLLVAGIPAIISGFLALLARKWLVFAATAAVMVTLTVTFIAVINGIVGSVLAAAVVPAWAQNGIGYAIPSDFALCVGAMVSSRVARAVYEFAMKKAHMFNTAQ